MVPMFVHRDAKQKVPEDNFDSIFYSSDNCKSSLQSILEIIISYKKFVKIYYMVAADINFQNFLTFPWIFPGKS